MLRVPAIPRVVSFRWPNDKNRCSLLNTALPVPLTKAEAIAFLSHCPGVCFMARDKISIRKPTEFNASTEELLREGDAHSAASSLIGRGGGLGEIADPFTAGSVAFIGFNATDPDQFAFVVLQALNPGEIFYVTDGGYTGATSGPASGYFRNTEGFLQYTAPAGGLPVGAVIVVNGGQGGAASVARNGGGSAGTVTLLVNGSGNTTSFSFASSGDSLTVYTVTGGTHLTGTPTLIAFMNLGTDPYANNTGSSSIPTISGGQVLDFSAAAANGIVTNAASASTMTIAQLSNAANFSSRNSPAYDLTTLSPAVGSLAIGDVTMAEGDAGITAFVFTVTRSGGASGVVGATWTLTLSGAAVAGDFTAFPQTGTVSFADGDTSETITINVQGDTNVELDELFTVVLSAPTGGATLADDTGLGTITNDDAPINGTAGPDDLNGTAGDDVINGLAGDDELEGLAGNDQLNGGDDNDVIYAGYGNDLADSGSGDDYIFAGFGNDTITGGDGFDTASYFDDDAVTGVTVDLNIVGAQNTGQGMDTLSGIEGLGGTQFADTLTGDDNANWLTTVLITGPGNDDTMDGRGGDDLISVGIGNHVLTGGADSDTLRFINGNTPTTAITLSLAAQGILQATGAGNWTYSGFENLSGGRAGDTLTGDGNANRLTGEGGNDIIDGGGGDDLLSGDASWNMGFHANGTAFGPAALRFVSGPTGDDSLDGGIGDDTATFLFEAGAGTLTIVADGADYLVRRDAVDVARISFSGATITVTGLNSGANLGTDTLTNIEHLSFAIDGGAPVVFDVPETNSDPIVTSGPGAAMGSATEAISLDGIPGADQTANNRLEPVINYDVTIVSLLSAHPNDMHAVLLGLQAQLPSGSGFAEAMAIVWDYVDDNFSYYNTVINEISARLTVEYALYLQDGGPALTGTAAKYTPDGGDAGTAPDRYQSLHDNILGNVNGAGLNDKFRGPPNGSNPTPDEDAYNRIIQLLADKGLSDLVNRPVYSGTEGAANLSLAYDQANGLLPATGGQLTATDPDFDPLTWSGSAQGIYGTFTIAPNGAWTYLLDQFDPDTQALGAGESALDTFTATVSDGNGGSATQLVTITVFGTNDAPVGVANAVLAGGSEDVVYHVTLAQLLAGFSDLDGDTLSVAGLTADHGTVTAEPGGFAITPAPNYHGPVVLSYQVDDGNGGSTSATQTFAVASVNDAPTVTGPVTASATEGGGVYPIDPLANASDADGDSLVAIPTGALPAGVSFVGGSAATIDFEDYNLGSVVGQHGWTDATPSSPDNEIVDVPRQPDAAAGERSDLGRLWRPVLAGLCHRGGRGGRGRRHVELLVHDQGGEQCRRRLSHRDRSGLVGSGRPLQFHGDRICGGRPAAGAEHAAGRRQLGQ